MGRINTNQNPAFDEGGGSGAGGGYSTVENKTGVALTQRSVLQFSDGLDARDQGGVTEAFLDPAYFQVVSVSDQQLTALTLTTLIDYTPTAAKRNYQILIYYRVVTAPTDLTITVSWTDGSGAQTTNEVVGLQAVGSYSVASLFINATNGTHIQVKAQAGTVNQCFVSATLEAL